MKPVYLRAFAALLACSLLLGCPRQTAVWVRGATVEELAFEFGTRRHRRKAIDIYYLRVDACEVLRATSGPPPITSAVWALDGDGPLASLRYGQVPDGYVERQQAAPLKPGCYTVGISGTGATAFMVDPRHGVTEMTDAELAPHLEPVSREQSAR